MKVSFKRHLWLAGVLVAGLSITGCSGGEGEVEDPLEDSEELAEEEIDSAMEDMEGDPLAAEPMDDYGGDSEALPLMEEGDTEDSYVSDSEAVTDSSESLADDMEDESNALIDQLDPVSDEDVENYKLEEEGADSYVAESEPMPETNNIEPADEGMTYEDSEPVVDQEATMADKSPAVHGNEVRYIAKPGDTLGTIAFLIYGNTAKWRDLADRNGISNPRNIYPGDVIVFDVTEESRNFANQLSQVQMETVVVEAGDSLSAISQRVLGDGSAWKYLWRFNEERIENPDFITVGQVISYVPVNNVTGIAKAAQDSTVR